MRQICIKCIVVWSKIASPNYMDKIRDDLKEGYALWKGMDKPTDQGKKIAPKLVSSPIR
jgi:hypothetical protein